MAKRERNEYDEWVDMASAWVTHIVVGVCSIIAAIFRLAVNAAKAYNERKRRRNSVSSKPGDKSTDVDKKLPG